MKRHTLTLLAALIMLTGCGDNGLYPTLKGKYDEDYTFATSQQWTDLTSDTMSLVMAAFMAEDYVVEHTLVGPKDGEKAPMVQILSDRGGPYSRDEIERQFADYLARPVKAEADKVIHSLDLDAGIFRIEETRGEHMTIWKRLYTQKGYVQASGTCWSIDAGTTDAINSVIDAILINPDIAYQ